MVIDIKMCRFDNVPWGFRLVGGSDFEIPLTVVKVTEGSLAEEAGLRLDDVIVRINDEPTSPMTHDEAHRVISGCGNVFFLGIQRQQEETEIPKMFPVIGIQERLRSQTPDPTTELSIQSQIDELAKSPTPNIEKEEEANEGIPAEEPSNLNEDEEIASLLSPEPPEMIEERLVSPGVNINRVFPKPAVCQSSEVLRELNAEVIKTKQEKELDKKKWTTFMQKPNRPIPKSKAQLEAEARAANAYKVQIIKNYKKPEPPRPPTPIPEDKPEVIEPPKVKTPPPEVEEEPPTDTEVPNLEPLDEPVSQEETQTQEGESSVKNSEESETKVEEAENTTDEAVTNEKRDIRSVDREGRSPSESSSLREKTEEELQLEQQLAHVQQQLLALANLPSTIQSTLDAVTKQLSELLPTFKLQTKLVKEATPEIKAGVEQEDEEKETTTETDESSVSVNTIIENETAEVEEKSSETIETEVTQSYHEETTTVKIETQSKQEVRIHECEISHRNIEEEQMEEEQNMKRKKEHGVIEELQKQIEHKETQKRKKSKRMFGPLVPQERPLVLPGGRRWYRPKDAYNDEFIAETLTAQAELIAGTAVGVNFMKYQKPEKKVDLDKSEVYKVLHHLDKSPIRGIEVRPPVVVAEADIRRVVES